MIDPDPRAKPAAATGRKLLQSAGFVTAVLVVAVNLRPAIVAIGPLTPDIQRDTGLGASAVSLLTTLPLLCLGGFAATASALGKRVGLDRGVLVALVLLIVGIGIRILPPIPALFLGSAVAGSGIAVANVLLPALIKRDAPHRLGPVMAAYSTALQIGSTVGSGATKPLGDVLSLSWRPTLALWGVVATIGLLAWVPRCRRRVADRPANGPNDARGVWRSRLGWSSAAFIGLQSGVYFSAIAWLPTIWRDNGLDAGRIGALLLTLGVAGMLGGLPMPLLATRMTRQGPLVLIIAASFVVGLGCVMVRPAGLAAVCAVAFGLSQGAALSLALTLYALRTRTTAGAAALSAMAQSAGYVIAALVPLLVGTLHDLVTGWSLPLGALAVLIVPLTVFGWFASRPRYLEDEVASAS